MFRDSVVRMEYLPQGHDTAQHSKLSSIAFWTSLQLNILMHPNNFILLVELQHCFGDDRQLFYSK